MKPSLPAQTAERAEGIGSISLSSDASCGDCDVLQNVWEAERVCVLLQQLSAGPLTHPEENIVTHKALFMFKHLGDVFSLLHNSCLASQVVHANDRVTKKEER